MIARGIHICESWIKPELCKCYLSTMYYYIYTDCTTIVLCMQQQQQARVTRLGRVKVVLSEWRAAAKESVSQAKQQKPAKKIVKLMGHNRACNSLTDFEYEAHAMTGNRNEVDILKVDWK